MGRGAGEGETILAIDFTQAILICAHHANDLATKASEGKEAKTFEEMVPEWCRDFADLFEKENFDELPEQKCGTTLLNSLQRECQPQLQSLPSQSQQTGRQVPRREPLKRMDPTIKVTHGFAVLLRQKERRQATTCTRLSQA